MDQNQDQQKRREAQPADEEIKKHGDQLARQVRDVGKAQPSTPTTGQTTPAGKD